MSSNVFEEFFNFFNALLIGPPDEEDVNDEVTNTLQSESTMEAISFKLSNTLKKYTNTVEQSVYANKTINIDCGRNKLEAWHLRPGGQKYTWYGAKIPNTSCIKYGCCYDVTQTANISLSSIQETYIEDHKEMFNVIEQEMKSQVQMTIGDNPTPLRVLNSAFNQVNDVSISNIKKILENLSLTTVESDQTINIISLSPLRCKNKCTEPSSAGFVEQSLNIEIAVNNIISDITNSVTETYISMSSDTKSSISNVSMKKIYIFAFFSCLLVITIYIICYLIVYFVARYLSGGLPPPQIVVYIGALILTIIILMIWAIILCVIRANGKLGAMFCFIR